MEVMRANAANIHAIIPSKRDHKDQPWPAALHGIPS
jgi:hypothetical protein